MNIEEVFGDIFNSPAQKWDGPGFTSGCPPKYVLQKKGELDVLAKFARTKPDFVIEKYLDVFREKVRLRNLIKAEQCLRQCSSESMIYGDQPNVDHLSFDFIYQRLGWKFVGKSPLEAIDPNLAKGINLKADSWGCFTASCQGAITLTLDIIKSMTKGSAIQLSDQLYWESLASIEHLGLLRASKVSPDNGIRCASVYLDSSAQCELPSTEDVAKWKASGCQFVIVDSTCYERGSAKLKSLIETCLGEEFVVLMLRSHLKLDCLATEYGRLGSLLVLAKSDSSNTSSLARGFWEEFSKRAPLYGTFAAISQIYPFLSDINFIEANHHWLSRVEQANRIVVGHLSELMIRRELKKVKLISFAHSKFFWIVLPVQTQKEELKYYLTTLRQGLHLSGVPHFSIASYPWDFLAITCFKNEHKFFHRHNAGPVLRISVPDFDEDMLYVTIKALEFWLKKIETFRGH